MPGRRVPAASSSSPPEEAARTGSSTTGTSRCRRRAAATACTVAALAEHADLHRRRSRPRRRRSRSGRAPVRGGSTLDGEQRLMRSAPSPRSRRTARRRPVCESVRMSAHESRSAAGVAAGDDEDRRHSPRATSARLAWPWRCRARAARQARTPLRQHSTMRGARATCSCVCSSASTSMRSAAAKRRDRRLGSAAQVDDDIRRVHLGGRDEGERSRLPARARPSKPKPPTCSVLKSTEIRRPSGLGCHSATAPASGAPAARR